MIPEPAARRYAEAAHLLSSEDGNPDEWAAGLTAMGTLFGDAAGYRFLSSKRVPIDQKRVLIEKALASGPQNVINLALLLLRRGRIVLGPQIAQAYNEIIDREKGVSHALVTSAVKLNADELRDVQTRLSEITGGTVVVRAEIDESIIGGLVVRIGDRLIDGSTRSRLVALKQQLAGAQR
jgi:F-type H+-transporting ATPase subunit delta